MAKLPAKLTPEQVQAAGGWQPPELGGTKTIRLRNTAKDRKIPASRTTRAPEKHPPSTDGGMQEPSANKEPSASKEPSAKKEPSTTQPPPEANTPDVAPTSQATQDAQEIEALIAADDSHEQSDQVAPAEPSEAAGADVGYAEGYQKGETEGFVKGEQAGYETGHEAGHRAGREAAEQAFTNEVAKQRDLLNSLVQGFSQPNDQVDTFETALLPLVTQICQTVLMGELKTESAHIKRVIRKALEALPHNASAPRAYVNPSDMEWLQGAVGSDVELVADAGLVRGGCRVETADSQVSADLNSRLREALITAWKTDDVEVADTESLQQLESEL